MKNILVRLGIALGMGLGFGSCSWDFYLEPSLEVSVQVEGLRDTLQIGRDTLTLRASLPQPVSFYDGNQRRKERNQTVQLASNDAFSILVGLTRVRVVGNNEVVIDHDDSDSLMKRVAVAGRIHKGLVQFQIDRDRVEMRVQYLPKEPGLYVITLVGGGVMDSETILPVETLPVFDVAQKNHHLLNEAMKKQVMLTDERSRRNRIAFYVRK